MMKFLTPWFMVLILGFCVFLIGKYIQKVERMKRLERRKLEMGPIGLQVSATTMLRPTSQSAQSAPGLHGLRGQGSQVQGKDLPN